MCSGNPAATPLSNFDLQALSRMFVQLVSPMEQGLTCSNNRPQQTPRVWLRGILLEYSGITGRHEAVVFCCHFSGITGVQEYLGPAVQRTLP